MAALSYAIGLLLERAEPQWFVGVRTPWTLEEDEVWRATHDRSAVAFKLAGVAALGGLFLPSLAVAFAVVPLLAATAFSLAHSFWAYRRRTGPSA